MEGWGATWAPEVNLGNPTTGARVALRASLAIHVVPCVHRVADQRVHRPTQLLLHQVPGRLGPREGEELFKMRTANPN